MQSKFERQTDVVFAASKFESYELKLSFLKSIDEFKELKDSSVLDKLRRWSNKVRSERKSEFRGCTYGTAIENLVACDIKNLLLKLHPNNKKFNCTIVNIDVLEDLLLKHCKKNGKLAVFEKMKRCKGWAIDFCRRHSFDRAIITVVGSSRSKANMRFRKSKQKPNDQNKKSLNMDFEVNNILNQPRRGWSGFKTGDFDCSLQDNSLCDVACGLLSLKSVLLYIY
jgi:hypothetical protein